MKVEPMVEILDIFSFSHSLHVHSFLSADYENVHIVWLSMMQILLLEMFFFFVHICIHFMFVGFLFVCIILVYSFCSVALQLIHGNNRIKWIVVSSSSSGNSVALFTLYYVYICFFSARCALNCVHSKLWCA